MGLHTAGAAAARREREAVNSEWSSGRRASACAAPFSGRRGAVSERAVTTRA